MIGDFKVLLIWSTHMSEGGRDPVSAERRAVDVSQLTHPITFSHLLILLSSLASYWMSRFDQDFQEGTIGSLFLMKTNSSGKTAVENSWVFTRVTDFLGKCWNNNPILCCIVNGDHKRRMIVAPTIKASIPLQVNETVWFVGWSITLSLWSSVLIL